MSNNVNKQRMDSLYQKLSNDLITPDELKLIKDQAFNLIEQMIPEPQHKLVRPRVFCMIRDGIIYHAKDEGVDFASFDYDQVLTDPGNINRHRVPADYTDLALLAGVPMSFIDRPETADHVNDEDLTLDGSNNEEWDNSDNHDENAEIDHEACDYEDDYAQDYENGMC